MIIPISKAALAMLLGSSQAIAGPEQASQDGSDPAAFFLLLFGLAALLLGMRNLRQLKDKRMMPPRFGAQGSDGGKAPPKHTKED